MNKMLQDFARNWLKHQLALCTNEQRLLFKKIYFSPQSVRERRKINDLDGAIRNADIGVVIDGIPRERLSRAMTQVESTLEHNR